MVGVSQERHQPSANAEEKVESDVDMATELGYSRVPNSSAPGRHGVDVMVSSDHMGWGSTLAGRRLSLRYW